MTEAVSLARLFHFVAFIMMAAPMYMLIVVNERARMGPPDAKMDRYMENIITRNAIRCFIFQGTVLASGLALLLLLDHYGLRALVVNWIITAKVVGTLLLVSLLSYVHIVLQPRINQLVDWLTQGTPPPAELPVLRRRRKRLSAVCLFIVLSLVVLGLQLTLGYSSWLTLLFLALAAVFAWRVYSSLARFGWL